MHTNPDEEQQQMRQEAQLTSDKNYARRLMAMLMLHRGITVPLSAVRLPTYLRNSRNSYCQPDSGTRFRDSCYSGNGLRSDCLIR